MIFANRSLAFKLSFYSACVLLGIFIAAFSLIGPWSWNQLNQQLENDSIAAVTKTTAEFDQILARAEILAKSLVRSLESNNSTKEEVITLLNKVIVDACQSDPHLIGVAIAYEPGFLIENERYNSLLATYKHDSKKATVVQFGNDKLQYFFRDWYIVPKSLGKGLWSNPFSSEGGIGTRLLCYSEPFYRTMPDGTTVFAGVVAIDIDVESLRELLSTVMPQQDGYCFMMTKFAQIVLHPNRDIENNQTLFSLFYQYKDDKARARGRRIMKNPGQGTELFPLLPFFKGGTQIFYSTTKLNGWKICMAVPAEWVKSKLMEYFLTGCLIFLAVAAIAIGGIIVVAKKMSKPLVMLSKAAQEIGQGNFNVQLPTISSSDEIGELSKSFSRMQLELKNYIRQMETSVAAKERIEGELNAARTIQNDILPKLLPPLPDCSAFSIAPALRPARAIGGDLYDIFFLDDDHLLLMVGDVSGKGIAAALFMAIAATLQRNISSVCDKSAEIVTRLNQMLAQNNNAMMFLTCFLGVLNIRTGELDYCNAGHNPTLCLHLNGSCEYLDQRHGAPLGIIEGVIYQHSTVKLKNGDTLIMYTDGVTEAFNRNGEMYTLQRLRALCENLAAKKANTTEMLNAILEDVDDFSVDCEQSDDITLLILRYNETSGNINKGQK